MNKTFNKHQIMHMIDTVIRPNGITECVYQDFDTGQDIGITWDRESDLFAVSVAGYWVTNLVRRPQPA
jgi:hypothetical protein